MVGTPGTLATTPLDLASRIAAEINAYTYAFLLISKPFPNSQFQLHNSTLRITHSAASVQQ